MAVASIDPAALLPVAVATIRCDEPFKFDLFLNRPSDGLVLYRGQNFAMRPADLASLENQGIRTLYIQHSSLGEYELYLREQVLTDPSLSPTARFCAAKEASRSMFMSAFSGAKVDTLLEVAGELGREFAETLCNEECTLDNLLGLLSHDYYTFTHVTNVAVYCLALAKTMGISSSEELAAIAQGALLHDIGKRQIALNILNKNGKLTDEEFRIVKLHPLTGFRELCRREDLSWAQLMMVYQHHERLDGRGYPVGIGGDEIHFLGRLCAVADVYDALSSYRPYRKPMPTERIREMFASNAGKHFDAEMVDCWDKTLRAKGSVS